MSEQSRYLLRHMLIHTDRYDTALRSFTNLSALNEVGALGHVLVLSEDPGFDYDYYTANGILL